MEGGPPGKWCGMNTAVAKDVTLMLLVGDAVLGLVDPTRHVRRWSSGPPAYKRAMQRLAANPSLVRTLAALELASALGYSSRVRPRG